MAHVHELVSPEAVLHFVRGEEQTRSLCREEGLRFERLDTHIKTGTPPHVKGWRSLQRCQWMQKGKDVCCVVGADAKHFIKYLESCCGHPMQGAFTLEDAPRLAHLLNSHWIWSNNEKVDHMHGWQLLPKESPPRNPERFLVHVSRPSPYVAQVCVV